MKEPCLGIVAIVAIFHHEIPKVGVVNHLHMRIVHNLVKFPPPSMALYPPLYTYIARASCTMVLVNHRVLRPVHVHGTKTCALVHYM